MIEDLDKICMVRENGNCPIEEPTFEQCLICMLNGLCEKLYGIETELSVIKKG